MKLITIPGTELVCSRLMFGTASLFNAGASQQRYRLLKSAVNAGFTHFDTAPLYGFGAAERDLKQILREHPNVTVTTKVGLYGPGGENQPDALVYLRKAAGRVFRPLSRPLRRFHLAQAQQSLDASLRRLGRECIDVYTLHEPHPCELDMDDWLRWLQDIKSAGKVRHFGVACADDRMDAMAARCRQLCEYVQVLDSLEDRQADVLAAHGLPLQVTYGYISAARRRGKTVDVGAVLTVALRRNKAGAIIVSTSNPDHTEAFRRVAEAAA